MLRRQRLILEGFGCARGYSVQEAYSFLECLSGTIDMRIIIPPIVTSIPVLNADDRIKSKNDFGVSAIVVWLESGAQLHTWPEHRFITLDVYSCKEFDDGVVVGEFKKWFSPERLSVGTVNFDRMFVYK